MSEETWGYSNPVGEWIATVEIPAPLVGQPMASLSHVLELVVPLVSPMHRLRKVVLSWGELDSAGEELAFHELEELVDGPWEDLKSRVAERVSSAQRVFVSALFLELDTQVIGTMGGGARWAEESAELQISFAPPEVDAASGAVMYSTSIDVWLPTTYTGEKARANEEMAAANLPRLKALLSALARISRQELQAGQSKLYQRLLSPAGFSQVMADSQP
jgi:hypothetical protein